MFVLKFQRHAKKKKIFVYYAYGHNIQWGLQFVKTVYDLCYLYKNTDVINYLFLQHSTW